MCTEGSLPSEGQATPGLQVESQQAIAFPLQQVLPEPSCVTGARLGGSAIPMPKEPKAPAPRAHSAEEETDNKYKGNHSDTSGKEGNSMLTQTTRGMCPTPGKGSLRE